MICIRTLTTLIFLNALVASAAPPELVLPTGACAGLVKKTSIVTYTDADSATGKITSDNLPYAHFYIDFDNGLIDIGGVVERSRLLGGDDSEQTILDSALLTQDATLNLKQSPTFRYAFEIDTSFTDLNGELTYLQGLLIPTNGAATFLVSFINQPVTGVCQKI